MEDAPNVVENVSLTTEEEIGLFDSASSRAIGVLLATASEEDVDGKIAVVGPVFD